MQNNGKYWTIRFAPLYEQTFEIDANGTLKVSKHNYWVSRSPSGELRRADGVMPAILGEEGLQ